MKTLILAGGLHCGDGDGDADPDADGDGDGDRDDEGNANGDDNGNDNGKEDWHGLGDGNDKPLVHQHQTSQTKTP